MNKQVQIQNSEARTLLQGSHLPTNTLKVLKDDGFSNIESPKRQSCDKTPDICLVSQGRGNLDARTM